MGAAAVIRTQVTPSRGWPDRLHLVPSSSRRDFVLSWERPCHWPGLGQGFKEGSCLEPEMGRSGGRRKNGVKEGKMRISSKFPGKVDATSCYR